MNNHPGSYQLGASYNGVAACGPGPFQGGTDYAVHFFSSAYPVLEWECVELVMRYMYLAYKVKPYSANGNTVVSNYSGSALTKVSNNGKRVPSPGDIISEAGTTKFPNGHTGVVTKVNVSSGTGTVTIMEENAGAKGWATIKVSANVLGSRVTGWLEPARRWTPVRAPLPANAGAIQSAVLNSVACPSASSCLVGGYYFDSGGNGQPLLETLSGTAWTPTQLPVPPGATNYSDLYSVACAPSSSCMAAGTYQDASGYYQGLLETQSGTTWTATKAPLPWSPIPNQQVYTASAACPSASSCVVAGWDGADPYCGPVATGSGDEPLLWAQSGNSWTATAAPVPAGASPIGCLDYVACPSASSCVAVGYYLDTSGNYLGLIETGSGTTWKPVQAPLPANAAADPYVTLTSVTCPSASACVAVGGYTDTAGNRQGLIAIWSGTTWTPVQAPVPADAGANPSTYLESVACTPASSCAAVGYYVDSAGNTQRLLETGSATTWTGLKGPLPAGGTTDASGYPIVFPPSVACPSASSCVTADRYLDSPGVVQGLIETRSGTTWKATGAPLPAGAAARPYVTLQSVACASASLRVIAGYYYDSSGNGQGLLVTGSG